MRIREATDADLEAISALEHSIFGADAWSTELVADELRAPHRCYLALVDEPDGVLHGYAGLLAVGTEGDVQTIAVDTESRGAGHGRRLLEALLEAARARHVRTVFLEVRADNPVAQSLYASLGFVEIAVRPRYYQPDGVDALVMRLELKEAA